MSADLDALTLDVPPPIPDPAEAPPAAELTSETWLRADWKHLGKAMEVGQSRNVAVFLGCMECHQQLVPADEPPPGVQVLMRCGCRERRWMR